MAPVSETSTVGSYRSDATATAGLTTDAVKFIAFVIATGSTPSTTVGRTVAAGVALSLGVMQPAKTAIRRRATATDARTGETMVARGQGRADKRSSRPLDQFDREWS